MQTKIINILREVERLDLKCEIVMVIDILRVTSTITNALKMFLRKSKRSKKNKILFFVERAMQNLEDFHYGN